MDYEGQGGSVAGRVPAHIDDFDLFLDDLGRLFERVPALRWHLRPVYLIGHSMGGLVAARFAQENPDKVDGLVLSSPMLGMLAPEGIRVNQLAGVAAFYASPAPYGLGLDKLCTSPPGVDQSVLVAIAACHGDETLRSCFYDPALEICASLTQCLLYGYPNDCGLPPIDFAGLQSALGYLQAQPEGCRIDPSAIDGCPYADLGMDEKYCRYVFGHRLHAPDFTFGWLNQAFRAQAELYQGVAIDLPTLILSDPNDQVVDASTHVCAPPISASESCSVATYADFGHELLAASKRAKPIGEVREVLIDWSE
jgi:pimeloyl-ACP methyl ester carboxylesterase